MAGKRGGAGAHTFSQTETRRGEGRSDTAVRIRLHIGAGLTACLWSQFRHGIRDYRVSAIICYYACPLQWPLLLALLVAGCILGSGYAEPLSKMHVMTLAGIRIDGVWLVAGASALLAIVCIVFWFRRLSAALWAARFANV